ncbi:BnaA10g28700D [Brassica napus]|uniref:BnaA10g28700D protein n=1 Tax=Brassica napus TaxID=3708 RepID=A0A078J679_BRANA|nr:BnaA10g28700D [Brassica napus]
MERNEEEARRAMGIAEKRLLENDYHGAKTFVNQARSLYPNLDGLQQALIMIDVYISASTRRGREADWYEILGVDRLADDETVKKQYKKLALLLHPDKNKFSGAEGAFKLLESDFVPREEKVRNFTFWTVCNRCKTYCRFARSSYVNKILPCPNCREDFVANEIIPEVVNGSPVIKLTPHFRPTCKSTSGASSFTRASASSSSAKAANRGQESMKYWFGES